MAQAILFLVGSGYNMVFLKYLTATLSTCRKSREGVYGTVWALDLWGTCYTGVNVGTPYVKDNTSYQAQLPRKWSKNRGRKSIIL